MTKHWPWYGGMHGGIVAWCRCNGANQVGESVVDGDVDEREATDAHAGDEAVRFAQCHNTQPDAASV